MSPSSGFLQNALRRAAAGDFLTRAAARHPQRRALRFRDRNYTFRELDDAVNRCARGLAALGIRKGDRAAILSHNCDTYIIYWWALLKLGAVITPVNWMLRPAEVRYILDHAQPKMFVVENTLVPLMSEIGETLRNIPALAALDALGSGQARPAGWLDFEDLWRDPSPAPQPDVEIEPEDPATLLYTSGTEAAPKGVVSTHLNFVTSMLSASADSLVQRDDVMLIGIPLYHMAGMWMFMACCALGALTILQYVPDRMEILQLTQEEKVTRWCWPTTVYMTLPAVPGFDAFDLRSLRVCQVFGSPPPPDLLERWQRIAPGVIFMNCYGQTEMTPVGTTIYGEELARRPNSVGRSMLPVELRIVGPDDRELPRGQVGEIVARGPTIMKGYFKNPEKTAWTQRGGWHHTGDLGWMDEEGYLYFVDRVKDMIKTGGENVASADVESALFQHPKVQDVAVIGLPDPVWGEAITAVVVPVPGETVTPEEILSWCKKNMAAYKVPKKVFLMEELPRNPSGKILKRELRKQLSGSL